VSKLQLQKHELVEDTRESPSNRTFSFGFGRPKRVGLDLSNFDFWVRSLQSPTRLGFRLGL
jgi:hypothetical protein